ncbi:MAG: L,D-transpeptidase family protein [Pseudomonadota bacterium]
MRIVRSIVPFALACAVTGPGQALPIAGSTDGLDPPATPRVSADPVAQALKARLETGHGSPEIASPAIGPETERKAALTAFYMGRGWKPVWTKGGQISQAGRLVILRLEAAAKDGLDPSDYPTPSLDLGKSWPVPAAEIARSELMIARSVLRFADHAQAGRVRPSEVSSTIDLTPQRPDPLDVLRRVAGSSDPVAALAAFNPPHQGFRALRERLAKLQETEATSAVPVVPVPPGASLRPGERDDRIVLLRARLNVVARPGRADRFDMDLRQAVIAFQEAAGLKPDGVVGPRTIAALNAEMPAADRAGILANMEMWRWAPRDFGAFHVAVNVPEYRLRIMRDGEAVHSTRIVVGKVRHKTPIFSDEMEHVVVNPYWNVPASIARNELLPSIRANPASYLHRRGYEVLYAGRRVNPAALSWDARTIRQVRIRQRPGRRNALGRVKFLFPNRHAVYLHDTPSRHLFDRPVRAYSHGCVRVQNPMEFADTLLTADPKWSGRQVRSLLGAKERWVNLSRHIPVHISYFTVWVNEAGKLHRAHDIYGHEAKVRSLLGL